MNTSTLSGRLTADPELRQTPAGVSVTSFTIAVDRSHVPKGGERQADFIDIVAWRGTAEFICKYFTKGKWIEINGSIQTRTYTDKNDNKRKAFEVVADHAGFGGAPKDAGAQTHDGAGYPPPPPAAPSEFDPFKAAGAPPPPNAALPSYTSGNGADFADFDDDGDLPF